MHERNGKSRQRNRLTVVVIGQTADAVRTKRGEVASAWNDRSKKSTKKREGREAKKARQ